ncbi:MAG: DUF4350 domain-containing protein [Chloroflexota bacterium]|nr:DUF4350 domain-containing protein [Chloroflexota bacterium]
MRRMHPLYVAGAILALASIALAVATGGRSGEDDPLGRSASVYDDGPGGASTVRRYFEAMGAHTSVVQGDRFVVPEAASVLFILGASEGISASEVATIRDFVAGGGTLVLAGELGVQEQRLLDSFGAGLAGFAAPGVREVATLALAAPPVRRVAIDAGREVTGGLPLIRDSAGAKGAVLVQVERGNGTAFVTGSLGPFLNANLGSEDNGRLALALAGVAFQRGGTVAFDEYHHGAHPSSSMLVVLERTWPGRALVFAGIAIFAYLVASGRRLGPPVPLDPRPPRSSLEYVRGFAGLVRRSGHGEIARRRIRRDLRRGLARAAGLDPQAPVDRMLAAIATHDERRAEDARRLDAALGERLPEARLLRTVRQVDELLASLGTDANR